MPSHVRACALKCSKCQHSSLAEIEAAATDSQASATLGTRSHQGTESVSLTSLSERPTCPGHPTVTTPTSASYSGRHRRSFAVFSPPPCVGLFSQRDDKLSLLPSLLCLYRLLLSSTRLPVCCRHQLVSLDFKLWSWSYAKLARLA